MKFKWKVAPAPTGPFSSFHRRGWPWAETADGSTVATIRCEDDYIPGSVKRADHKPLRVNIRVASKTPEEIAKHGGFRWCRLVGEFRTLDDAKQAFANFVVKYPNHPFFA